MTSYGSTSGLSYRLSKRHLPRSQTEALPIGDDGDSTDDEASSVKASSLRANFLPPGAELGAPEMIGVQKYGSLRSESLMSPVFSQLSMVRPERLQEASENAQALRRKLMRGSHILIVQGGYLGKQFIYDRLKELDCIITIMDGPDSAWRGVAEEGLIDDFIELDFSDHETVFSRAMDAISDAMQDTKFDAVTTYFEDAVALAARIATALGLEVNPIQACEQARNKRLTREVMGAAGLPVPLYYRINSARDISPACAHVGFPAIMKPYPTKDSLWYQGTEMVIEEYYDGDEFDIDVLLWNGEAVYSKVSDNWACWEPWFQETGTNCPSLYPLEKQKELIKLSVDATLALGFRAGCFHVECKYSSRGPRLIEVNARMGGVSVRDINKHAWGVDLVEEHAMCALRIPIRPLIPEKPLEYMAECAVNAPYSGTVNAEKWLDFVLEDKRVHKINYFKQKGDRVHGPEDGMPDWIVEIIVVSKTSQQEACDILCEIVTEKAMVPITPKRPGSEKPY
eukprot:IDg17792t1